MENSKANEPHKFVLNLRLLDLRNSNKHVALQNLPILYPCKNIRRQYRNKKPLKIIATTWNNEFKLPDGCYSESDIQDHIEYIIKNKKHYLLILLFVFTSI